MLLLLRRFVARRSGQRRSDLKNIKLVPFGATRFTDKLHGLPPTSSHRIWTVVVRYPERPAAYLPA